MATPKAREGSNLKERERERERERENSAPSSLQSTWSSNERRSPRPTTPDNHKQQQQQTPLNNIKLKSTVAPVIAPKFTTSKRLPLQKSPTPPTPKSRTTLPSAPLLIKEGPPVRLPYAAPRQFASLKPSWPEKVSKSASSSTGAKTGQVARARAVESRREAVVPSTSAADKKTTEVLDSGREATSTVDTSAAVNKEEALAAQKEEDIIIIGSLEKKEQDPVDDSTPTAEAHDMEYPQFQLNSNADEETTKDYYSMQTEEKKAEATNESTPPMEEEKVVEEISTDSSSVEEGSKIRTTKPTTTTPRRGHRGLPAVEPATEEAKPTKIRAAMDASKRNTEAAVKKETVRSNDVIEVAKSKLLEKRKNKVLALVGAFETVMALQEPEGQQPNKAKEEDAESSIK